MKKCPHCGAPCDGTAEIVTSASGRPIVTWQFDCYACDRYGVVTSAEITTDLGELERVKL